jgi:tRNA(fMet)-specific endonuclease VapC
VSYLLDTNVCIALINGTSIPVRANYIQAVRRNSVLTTSSIVAHELWYGVAKSGRVPQNANRLATFLGRDIALLDYSERDAQAAGEVRVELDSKGQHIGEYDKLISGQAFSRNLVLVTANAREFGKVRGLIVEDWTQ